jgi:hypothetical protein
VNGAQDTLIHSENMAICRDSIYPDLSPGIRDTQDMHEYVAESGALGEKDVEIGGAGLAAQAFELRASSSSH